MASSSDLPAPDTPSPAPSGGDDPFVELPVAEVKRLKKDDLLRYTLRLMKAKEKAIPDPSSSLLSHPSSPIPSTDPTRPPTLHLEPTVPTSTPTTSHERLTWKPLKPDVYEGCRDAAVLNEWLSQVEKYGEACGLGDEEMVVMAVTYLKKDANTWWDFVKKQDVGEIKERPKNWEEFCERIRASFLPSTLEDDIRDRLHYLVQKMSA